MTELFTSNTDADPDLEPVWLHTNLSFARAHRTTNIRYNMHYRKITSVTSPEPSSDKMYLNNLLLAAITALSTPVLSHPTTSLRQINPRQVQDFRGHARILVVNSTGYIYDVPDAYNHVIGCINNIGKVVPLSDKGCAVFEKKGVYPTKIVSPEGNNCTHFNVAQPVNGDSYYGKDSYAWYCGATAERESKGPGWLDGETYYTINGFDHPYICSGNIGCSRDMLAPPTGPDGKYVKDFAPLPLWMFYWGGEEYNVVKGHVEVLLLWDLLKNQ